MRDRCTTTIAAAAALALAAGPGASMPPKAQDGEIVEGPAVTSSYPTWGKRRPVTEGIEAVAAQVTDRTGGNVTIDIACGEQLLKARETRDEVAIGAFPLAMVSAAKRPSGMVPDLPFLPLPGRDATQAVSEAVCAPQQVQAHVARRNAMPCMSAIIPQCALSGSGDAPQSLSDFEGMRIRALGGPGRALVEIGARPTPIPASEIHTALDRGTNDATGFSLASMLPFGFHAVSDGYTVGMNPGTLNCPLVINTDAFAALPAPYRDRLMEAREVGRDALKAADRDGTERVLDIFEAERVTARLSDEEMAAFRAAAGQPIRGAWIAENEAAGLPARALFDLVTQTAAAQD